MIRNSKSLTNFTRTVNSLSRLSNARLMSIPIRGVGEDGASWRTGQDDESALV